MSSSKIMILSLVSAVLAVPHVHNHGGHNHLHKRHGAPYPYPAYNTTVLAAGTGTTEAPTSTNDLTTTITNYSTVIDYITVTPAVTKDATAEEVQPASSANAADSVCGGVVTSTYTNKVTVTVTAGSPDATLVPSEAGVGSSPAPSFVLVSSSVAAEGPEPTFEAPAYTPEPSTTPEEPETTPAPEPETTVVAPVEPTSSAIVVPAPAPSASPAPSAPATPPTSGSPSGGKRGLAYNDASLCSAFDGDNKVSWAYNWGQVSNGLATSFQYVPMLWGDKAGFTGTWEKNAHASIDAGELNVLGMNEPDHVDQANMSPAVAHQFWNQYLAPLKSYNPNVRLGSPAVTNGGGNMGLTWLNSFMSECSDCEIDFCAVHWYDSATNVEYFKKHMNDAHTACGGKPIWVTEFGCTGSADQIATFLETVMTWMDSQDFIERYSYFMVTEGNLINGLIPNALGALYASL